jgi:hypothetical protein
MLGEPAGRMPALPRGARFPRAGFGGILTASFDISNELQDRYFILILLLLGSLGGMLFSLLLRPASPLENAR